MSILSKEKTSSGRIRRTSECVQRRRPERRCNALKSLSHSTAVLKHIPTASIESLLGSQHCKCSIYSPCHHCSPRASEHVLGTLSHYLAIKILQTQVDAHKQTYIWQLASRDENTPEALARGRSASSQSLISPLSMLSLRLILAFLPTN